MKQNINFCQFTDAFRDYGREDQFSYNGLRALYDYLEQYEDDTGEEVELDVIALCCEYTEDTIANILEQSNCDDIRELEDNTTVIYVDDPPGRFFDIEEDGDITIIIQDF